MRRGDLWWADLGPRGGRRPVVSLSRDEAYAMRALVTIAPITARVRNIPVEVAPGPADGLPRPCAVNLDTIITIPKAGLQEYIASLQHAKLAEVDAALRFALGLSEGNG
jgi:mRNA interferase MazF